MPRWSYALAQHPMERHRDLRFGFDTSAVELERLAARTGRHGGGLPRRRNALTVGPANVQVTAVLPRADGMLLRMYESGGKKTGPDFQGGLLRPDRLASLDGKVLDALGPFGIGHAALLSAGVFPR